MSTDKHAKAKKNKAKPKDIAEHLEGDADALPSLVFDAKGNLVDSKKNKAKAKSKSRGR